MFVCLDLVDVYIRVARFFLVQTYRNVKNIPNDHKLHQKAINYTEWSKNITAFSIPRPSKFYQKWDFGLKTNHLVYLHGSLSVKAAQWNT
jgi:hypothetical protein